MNSSRAQADLVSLIAGEIDAATLAARHGVTEAEVLRWRTVFVAGMKASVGGQAMGRSRRPRMVLLAGMVLATAAFAQLTVFNADQPAQASQVNANFNQLKTWLEAKVGTVPGTSISTSSITATGAVNAASLSATGGIAATGRVVGNSLAPSYTDWNGVVGNLIGSAGIVNDNVGYRALMIAGNTAAGGSRKIQLYDDVSIANDLVVGGNAWGGVSDTGIFNFGNNAGLTYTQCPNGQYVCGIGTGHQANNNNYWTGALLSLRCCQL